MVDLITEKVIETLDLALMPAATGVVSLGTAEPCGEVGLVDGEGH